MFDRTSTGALALAATLLLSIGPAQAHDETKYPDWGGMWRRPPGVGIQWDETKPPGLGQQAPLKSEFQKVLEDSIVDQKAGGQGGDFRVTCVSNGMPRPFPSTHGPSPIDSMFSVRSYWRIGESGRERTGRFEKT